MGVKIQSQGCFHTLNTFAFRRRFTHGPQNSCLQGMMQSSNGCSWQMVHASSPSLRATGDAFWAFAPQMLPPQAP